MRVLQIDRLAPQSDDLALHPHLTVVVGPSPGLVARLRSFFVALVDQPGAPPLDPVLELGPPRWHPSSGPGGPTSGRLRATAPVPPPSSTPSPPQPSAPGPVEAGPEDLPVVDPGAVGRDRAARDLERLEAQLRIAAGERMVLERRIVDVRVDLDPFASASLEAARANLADLARRQEEARSRARHALEVTERLDELRAALGQLDVEERRLTATDPEMLAEATSALAAALAPARHPDPAAVDLAHRLDATARATALVQARNAAVQDLVDEATERLAEARAEVDAARSGRLTDEEAQVVARLEAVRDRIFDAVEGRRVGARGVDLAELRAEEAELLDRLGVETYTEFVMGAHAEAGREARTRAVELAEARMHLVEAELARLRSLLGDPDGEPGDAGAARDRLLEEAAAVLDVAASVLARLTTAELVDLLLDRTVEERPDPEVVRQAAVRVRDLLAAHGDAEPGGPDELLTRAGELLAGARDPSEARRELARRRSRLAEELDRLRAEQLGPEDQAAEEVVELDEALAAARARVADDEARLDRHEVAVARLAELRAEDLRLAETEDRLRDAAEEQRRVLAVLGAPEDGEPQQVTDATSVEAPPPPPPAPAPAAEFLAARPAAPDRAWRLVQRASELRAVPGLGAVPLLVLGVDADAADTDELLRRIQRLSALLQLVVTTDDGRVAAWAEQLGPELARVVRP